MFDDPRRLLWKANTNDGRKIVIKFTDHYSEKAHRLCSQNGRAPELLYINRIINGFFMVVMDYIDSKPLDNCDSLKLDDYEKIIKDVENAVELLHNNDIVFADLRASNILVYKEEGHFRGMLTDFDWAGEERKDRYPSFMNHEIIWPLGAEDRMVLRREHDKHWLNMLKKAYLYSDE